MVDRFVMGNGLIIFLVSVAHAVMSLLNKSLTVSDIGNGNNTPPGFETVDEGDTDIEAYLCTVDYVLLVVAFLGWLSGVVWFLVKWKRTEDTSSASGQLRESTRRRAAKRAQHDDQEASMLTDSSSSLATMLSDSSAPVSPPR